MTRPVFLIGCSGQKLPQAAPARDLYQGDLFRKALAWADQCGAQVFVLSALHGLVAADAVIAPYDRAMDRMDFASRQAWSSRVYSQFMRIGHPTPPIVTVLAGRRYRHDLVPRLSHAFPGRVCAPLAGLGIGEQKAWLLDAVAAGARGRAA